MADTKSFFDKYAPYAQAEQARSGVPASVTLAQAAIESGYGKSGLTKEANNFFGIKADGSWFGATYWAATKEYINGAYETIMAGFRKYTSPAESFADHSDFLTNNGRYAPAFQTTNGVDFARAVAAAGYATSPDYAGTLVSVIEDNNLTQYDAPITPRVATYSPDGVGTIKTVGWFNPTKWLQDLGIMASPKDFQDAQKSGDKIDEFLNNNGIQTPNIGSLFPWDSIRVDLLKASKYAIIVILIVLLIVFVGVILIKETGAPVPGIGG